MRLLSSEKGWESTVRATPQLMRVAVNSCRLGDITNPQPNIVVTVISVACHLLPGNSDTSHHQRQITVAVRVIVTVDILYGGVFI